MLRRTFIRIKRIKAYFQKYFLNDNFFLPSSYYAIDTLSTASEVPAINQSPQVIYCYCSILPYLRSTNPGQLSPAKATVNCSISFKLQSVKCKCTEMLSLIDASSSPDMQIISDYEYDKVQSTRNNNYTKLRHILRISRAYSDFFFVSRFSLALLK